MTDLQNHNPYVGRFLRMYSQSRVSNTGTRGYDELIYVSTKLDEILAPIIKRGEYSLVIISGNAGDGKTAFIQRIEESVRRERAWFAKESSGGCQFRYQGKDFTTVYDGSQDQEATGSDEVLTSFFDDFSGEAPSDLRGKQVKVIAINEGRLLHFLSKHRDRYAWLASEIARQVEQGGAPSGQALVVNLNLRAVVDGRILDYEAPDQKSIFDKLLAKFLDPRFWAGCQTCEVANRCYIKFNVDSLADHEFGPLVRPRLKVLFQTLHFRRRLHLTIRDLKSALAYILVGVKDCPEIQADLERGEHNLRHFYYNATFEREERDRALQLLGELDVAEVANPQLDDQLNASEPNDPSLFMAFKGRAGTDMPGLLALAHQRSDEENERRVESAIAYHAALRRKYFFENTAVLEKHQKGEAYVIAELPELTMLPTRHVAEFAGCLANQAGKEDILTKVLVGLNRGAGIAHPAYEGASLCVLTSLRTNPVRAFARFPKEAFEIRAASGGFCEAFVEYTPDAVLLVHRPRGHQILISLDLYEAIMRMRAGYVPSTAEVKGFLQNLQLFRRQLLGSGSQNMILLDPSGTIVSVEAQQDGSLSFRVGNRHASVQERY